MRSRRLKKFLFIVIIVAILLVFNKFGGQELRNTFYLITAPFSKIFWLAGEEVSDFFVTIFEIKNLKKEKESLQKQKFELSHRLISCQEIQEENKFLREALNLVEKEKFELGLVEVLAKEIDDDFILISGGKNEGIFENMPVITQEGVLVGKVKESFSNFSKVMLISALESRFEIEVQGEKRVLGVAEGRGGSKLGFQLVPKEVQIEKGNLVQTTTLGGNFPKGLLVGEVEEVRKSDVEPYQEGEIKPYFVKQELKLLFVIKKFYF
jgi:rod shape-determining protein MreC